MRSNLTDNFIRKIAGDSVLYIKTDKKGKTADSRRITYDEWNGTMTDIDIAKKMKIKYNPNQFKAEEKKAQAEQDRQEGLELDEIELTAEEQEKDLVDGTAGATEEVKELIKKEKKEIKEDAKGLKDELIKEKKTIKKATRGRKKA